METPAPDPAPPAPMEQSPTPETALPAGYACPNCGGAVDPLPGSPVLQCPQCKTQFFPPTAEDADDTSADDEKGDEELDEEAELDALRIRQLSTLRRTAYRTRTYLIVGTAGCLFIAIQLLIFAVQSTREHHHWGRWPSGCVVFALASLIGAVKFAQRVAAVQRGINADLRARELEEQEAARHVPDLSTLSDGSHHAKNLEKMFGSGEGEDSRGSSC